MSILSKKNREFIQLASNLSENYYPEIMWQMYVINTPFIFKAAWIAIKPFLNERTRNRIKMFGNKYHEELFKIVDPENLPEKIGGNWTCQNEGGNCFMAWPGPWDDYPGDEIGEAAKLELQELTAEDGDDAMEWIGEGEDYKEYDLEDLEEKKIPTFSHIQKCRTNF